MREGWINYGEPREQLPIRINGTNPTFVVDSGRIERSSVAPLNTVLLDLIDVSCFVFAADSALRRGGATRGELGSDWDRRIEFRVPVRNPEIWRRQDVRTILEQTVSFLTGDTASFVFIERDEPNVKQAFLDFNPETDAFKADEIILFSGGLDSFSGALEALSTRQGNVILVTHRSAQKAIPRQEQLGGVIRDKFPGRVLHLQVKATNKRKNGRETTQRSRSLLFAALGQAVASAFGARQVSFYENGVISHNLPINEAVVGTMATRTTHPLSLVLLNRLMEAIDPRSVPIRNPYEWFTKAEVVQRGLDHGSGPHLRRTVSCTSVREQNTLHTHCGSCSQCLDRRFAILSLGLADADPAEMYKVDVLTGSREGELSRTMANDWTRHSIALRSMPAGDFASQFAGSLADLVRGHPGLPSSQTFARTFEMHRRHGETVLKVMEKAISEHSAALAIGSLPPTSLLRMHIGPSGNLQPEPRRAAMPKNRAVMPEAEKDFIPDADAPLQVTFEKQGKRPVVHVIGIGAVYDSPAAVAHALRLPFVEDRNAEKPRKAYRYTKVADLTRQLSTSKEAVHQNIRRCRKTLREYYMEVHGSPPKNHLLIESGQKPLGYRLDPDIRIVAAREAVESGTVSALTVPMSGSRA